MLKLKKIKEFYDNNKAEIWVTIAGIGVIVGGVAVAKNLSNRSIADRIASANPKLKDTDWSSYASKEVVELAEKYDGKFNQTFVPIIDKKNAIKFVNDMNENNIFQIDDDGISKILYVTDRREL